MNNLRHFIEHTLSKRQAQQPKLEAVQENLRELHDQLMHLRRLASDVTASADAPHDLRQRAATLVNAIGGLEPQLSEATAKTANLLSRFTKKTINIGVAGKARQGKSTILQAISGLDNRVIPTSDGLPCTGAKSRILHRSDAPHAEIEFYTEAEFLREIVHAYFEELRLSPTPTSLDEFQRSLPSSAQFEKPQEPPLFSYQRVLKWFGVNNPQLATPEEHAIYDKLKELHANLGAYRSFLSRSPQRISLDEVREYVSQEDGRKRYVAVRCANIYVPFPNGDVTGLAIVDLPGLGEIAKGHSEKLVTSLQREIDAVILVKRPAAGGDDWFAPDIKVFNLIKRAVPELDLADWLFVVLNVDGQNIKQVEILRSRPPKIGSEPRLLVANCLQAEAVRQQVFLEVLQHLEKNLERTDQRLLSWLAEQLAHLANEVSAVVHPVWDYLQRDTVGTGDYQKFGELFRSFLKRLRTNLDELTEEYRESLNKNAHAAEFVAAVNEACDNAETTVPIPHAAELKGQFHDRGGWKAVVQEELHHLRSYLTHCLAANLDRKLAGMVEEVQQQVIQQVLAEPLDHVLPPEVRDSTNPRQKLEAFRKLLDPEDHPTLIAGVDYLLNFTFSYQSHFHHRVRQAMNPLDPMAIREEGDDDPVTVIAPRSDDSRKSEEVARGLRSFYERVVWIVRKHLRQEMENDPMRTLFALVEETRDQLVRTREIERQWERLLYPRRGEIWPREFNRFAAASAIRREWQATIDTIVRTIDRLRSTLV
jgi:hypothetical protein